MNEELNSKLQSGVYQGTPETAAASTPTPTSSRIRTMKSDVSEAIKTQHETSVSIALAEEKKKEALRKQLLSEKIEQPQAPQRAARPVARVFFAGIILLCFAGLGLAYVFVVPKLGNITIPNINISLPDFKKSAKTETEQKAAPIIPLADSIIPAQSEKRITLTNKTPLQLLVGIKEEGDLGITSGTIKNVYLTEKNEDGIESPITANRLIAFSKIVAPEEILRTIEAPFMVGYYGEQNGEATPFLLLTITDSDTGIVAMLAWEEKLLVFLTTFTEWGSSSSRQLTSKFSDVVINKKDAREATTAAGQTILYTFPSENTILITGSRTAMSALLRAYSESQRP